MCNVKNIKPAINQTMKAGQILIAKKECIMINTKENALIIGKEYPIKEVRPYNIVIKSEVGDNHLFGIHKDSKWMSYWGDYFDLK
jgi:hypothetical protein